MSISSAVQGGTWFGLLPVPVEQCDVSEADRPYGETLRGERGCYNLASECHRARTLRSGLFQLRTSKGATRKLKPCDGISTI